MPNLLTPLDDNAQWDANLLSPNFVDLLPPAGLVENDTLFLHINLSVDVIPTPPPEFVPVPGASITGVSTTVRIYQKIVAGDEPETYRVYVPDGTTFSAGLVGVHPTSLTYAYAQAVAVNSTATPSTSKVWTGVTTVDANELLLCFGAFAVGGGSTPHAGMTERYDGPSATTRLYLMTETVVAAGATGTRTATGTSATLIRTVTIAVSETNTLPFVQDFSEIQATEMPVFLELEGEGIQITQMGVLAEFGAIGIYLTQYPVLVELQFVEPEPDMPVHTPRADGTRAMHKLLPEEVSGYAFDPDFSWWSTIVAEKSVNLIKNPSFEAFGILEYDDSGDWTDVEYVEFGPAGATAGRRCADLETAALTESYFEYDDGIAVTPGPYTWSLDVYVTRPGSRIRLEIRDTGTVLRQHSFLFDNSGWQRIHMTYVELGTGTRQLRLISYATNPANMHIYTDAWQFEAKRYPTTYFDGDNIGFNDVRPFQSYYWHGAPHRSASTRYETTGSGGRIISWGDKIGFNTTSIVGLDMTAVDLEIQELGDGREIHRASNFLARTFTIVGRIFSKNPRELSNKKNHLIALFRPNLTLDAEQVMLRYQEVDSNEQLVGPPLDIVCAYSEGLQGNMTNFNQEALALQFHASQPFMREVIDSSAEILFSKTLVENSIFFRDADGDYVNLGAGVTTGSVLGIGFARDGSPVAIGNFTMIAGSAPVGIDRAARWDGSAWVPYGEPAADLQFLLDGRRLGYEPAAVYDAASIAIYVEGSDSWAVLGDPFLGAILALDRDTDGNIWVAGEFETDDPAVTTYNNVAMWNFDLDAWEPLGQGLTDPGMLNPDLKATTILATNDGSVYVGGWFERGDNLVGDVTTLANSAIRWDIATQVWDAMGSGLNAAPTQFIQGQDGYIYAVGGFDQNGTETFDLRGFARYNGYEWEEVFPLQRVDGTYGADGVALDENGVFWFHTLSTTFPDDYFDIPELGQVGTFGWKDGTFYPPFADVTLRKLVIGPGDTILYNGFGISGSTVLVPALNTITYTGTADAPLAFFLEGPAHPVHVVNLSTKGGIYFKHTFNLGDNENMVARSDTQKAMVYSNARPNLYKFLSAGISSMKSLRLRPGVNRISVFIEDDDADTIAWVAWKNRYQALSGPVED